MPFPLHYSADLFDRQFSAGAPKSEKRINSPSLPLYSDVHCMVICLKLIGENIFLSYLSLSMFYACRVWHDNLDSVISSDIIHITTRYDHNGIHSYCALVSKSTYTQKMNLAMYPRRPASWPNGTGFLQVKDNEV